MRYLLDTHVWIWMLETPGRLSPTCMDLLCAEEALGLSGISLWEMSMLVTKRRITLNCRFEEWLERAIIKDRIELLDIRPEVAIQSYRLSEDFHGDPADRIIAATALANELELVTADRRLLQDRTLTLVAAC